MYPNPSNANNPRNINTSGSLNNNNANNANGVVADREIASLSKNNLKAKHSHRELNS